MKNSKGGLYLGLGKQILKLDFVYCFNNISFRVSGEEASPRKKHKKLPSLSKFWTKMEKKLINAIVSFKPTTELLSVNNLRAI